MQLTSPKVMLAHQHVAGFAPRRGIGRHCLKDTKQLQPNGRYAYSPGMINFFFRGKLTVDPIPQRVFAVMNQVRFLNRALN
jgi:hypothetical protein